MVTARSGAKRWRRSATIGAVPEPLVDHAVAAPAPALAAYVRRYAGYRYCGLPPGTHLGLPSRDLTVVLAFDGPTRMAALPDPAQPPAALAALAGGLHTRPVVIAYEGAMEGVQLALTPRGARALLGIPAGELAQTVVSLDALLGAQAGELLERLHDAGCWPARFTILDAALARRVRDRAAVPAPLDRAWRLLTAGHRAPRIAAVGDEVGYSRRQLDVRFAREYGVGPKQAARLARFERSHRLLKMDPTQPLARVAAACGFYDQAHMAREWNALAGCAPSRWLAHEQIPFVQDELAPGAQALAA
jgi:AraC-like DNA-binding protein